MKRKTDDMQRKIDASVTKRGQAEAKRYLENQRPASHWQEILATILFAIALAGIVVGLLAI
jgi:hypothetical protein